MQIDWFTLLAQIVNFLILLYLLKRFLYGPIIGTMDKREQGIAARLHEAEEKRREAEKEQARYRRQRRELAERRDEALTAVRDEIETRRKEMLAEVQEEVAQKKQDWHAALLREQDTFLQELRLQLGREAGEIAYRALRDMAGVQMERRMADLFVVRLRELDAETRERISESIRKANGKVLVHSAFELPTEVQQIVTDGIREHAAAGDRLHIQFEMAPELISGIEMWVHGHQVSWTMKAYLAGLDAQIRQTIEQETQERHRNGSNR